MKRLSVVGGICASLLLGAAGMAVAQDEHKQDEHKNDRQETVQPQNRQEQARPEDRRSQEPESGDRKNTTSQSEGRQNQEPQSGDRHPQTRENDRQMQEPQERPNMEKPQEREQGRREQARPQGQVQGRAEGHGGNQRRIPDRDFHAHFGREHHFAPGRVQVYGGRPQFTYSGFVFALVEPWPVAWAYDDDDYYIDYVDDEYWLYSLRYPGVRLELIIVD
jgi:hypothetical protein